MKQMRAQRGLTLVELLLGLAITAVVMVPLAALFQGAASSGVSVRTALDLNSDARFAMERIARRTAGASIISDASGVILRPGVAPAPALTYTVVGTDLVETENATVAASQTIIGSLLTAIVTVLAPTPPRTSVIAANAASIKLSAPATAGQPLLKIDLTLAAAGAEVSASRTVRVGSAP
jgi:prepilin-type N-terminal cleavage/methylation domain-containing protein